jgi:hypothetical protein
MPILNISGVLGNNKTLLFRVCFLLLEKEGDYIWAMKALINMIKRYSIKIPLMIIMDRELALLNALEASFILSRHILC